MKRTGFNASHVDIVLGYPPITVRFLSDALYDIRHAIDTNGHFERALALRIMQTGKPIDELTIGEFRQLIKSQGEHYNAHVKRTDRLYFLPGEETPEDADDNGDGRDAYQALFGPERIREDDDGMRGMAWWNALSETDRALWLTKASSARPADAWAAYKKCTPGAAYV